MEGRYHRQLKLSISGDYTLRLEKRIRLNSIFKIVPTVLIRRFNIGKINIYAEDIYFLELNSNLETMKKNIKNQISEAKKQFKNRF